MIKIKNHSITDDQFKEIYDDTFEMCKKNLNSKGINDFNVIKAVTDVSVSLALKKSHISYKKNKGVNL